MKPADWLPMRPLCLREPISFWKSPCCIFKMAASFQMYLQERMYKLLTCIVILGKRVREQ